MSTALSAAPAAPATAPATDVAPVAAKRKRPNIGLMILGLVLAGLAAFGTQRWLYGRNHVVTDNAQVEGHIVPVLSRVTGYVTAVNAHENEQVKSGDLL